MKNRAGFSLGLIKLLFFRCGFDVVLDDANDDGRGGVDDGEEE